MIAPITTRAIIQGINACSRPNPDPRTSFNCVAIKETTSEYVIPVVVSKVVVAFDIKVFIFFYNPQIRPLQIPKCIP